jgi:hypothetical protein
MHKIEINIDAHGVARFGDESEGYLGITRSLIIESPILLRVLKSLVDGYDIVETDGRFCCRWCGKEFSALTCETKIPGVCPVNGCPSREARMAISRAEGYESIEDSLREKLRQAQMVLGHVGDILKSNVSDTSTRSQIEELLYDLGDDLK